MTTPVEREIKLRYDTPDAARRAVIEAGARPLRARRLQSDCLLDREREPLADRARTLRVRIDGGAARVTFKGAPKLGTTKVREELETSVGDGELMLRVLERIGFRVWFRYEKYREEFRRGDLVIAVDEAPIGTFVELEGGEPDILAMAAALGREPADFILDSYLALFRAHCDETGASAEHMVFDARAPAAEPRDAPRPPGAGRPSAGGVAPTPGGVAPAPGGVAPTPERPPHEARGRTAR